MLELEDLPDCRVRKENRPIEVRGVCRARKDLKETLVLQAELDYLDSKESLGNLERLGRQDNLDLAESQDQADYKGLLEHWV